MEANDNSRDGLVKVAFELEESELHDFSVETMWAEPLGGSLYRLENVPFYAYGYSYMDVVEAVPPSEDDFPVVQRVIRPAGHSTYRLVILGDRGCEDNPEFDKYWLPLQELGCRFEGLNSHFLAVDVPPESDCGMAFDLLTIGEEEDFWGFEAGNYAHP